MPRVRALGLSAFRARADVGIETMRSGLQVFSPKAGVDDVHVAPTAQALEDAIDSIVNVRRTLRFIQP